MVRDNGVNVTKKLDRPFDNCCGGFGTCEVGLDVFEAVSVLAQFFDDTRYPDGITTPWHFVVMRRPGLD